MVDVFSPPEGMTSLNDVSTRPAGPHTLTQEDVVFLPMNVGVWMRSFFSFPDTQEQDDTQPLFDPFEKTSALTDKLQRKLGIVIHEDRVDLGAAGTLPVHNGTITLNAKKFVHMFLLAILHLIYMSAASATMDNLKHLFRPTE